MIHQLRIKQNFLYKFYIPPGLDLSWQSWWWVWEILNKTRKFEIFVFLKSVKIFENVTIFENQPFCKYEYRYAVVDCRLVPAPIS